MNANLPIFGFHLYWWNTSFFVAFIVCMMIDGFKAIMESFWHGNRSNKGVRPYAGNGNDVTIVVAAYNEEATILAAIKSFKAVVPARNIIIVDDGSKDRTAEMVRTYAPDVLLLSIKNRGKVGALHHGLRKVTTPYVFILDADIEFEPGFVIPTKALEDGHATAVCFNVVPTVDGKSFQNRVLLNSQRHEYAKSMQIGKRFSTPTKSVHCISGAAGLFVTERLQKLAENHSMISPGEDLERTLQELGANGDVIFSDSTVYTDVPKTLAALTRQRVFGWWPGMWRNLGFFLKLISKRKEPFRLRYELAYEVFALLTIPLKFISLAGLVMARQWQLLLFIYAMYLCLEVFIHLRIRSLTKGRYIKMEALIIMLYPFYAEWQMVCLTGAFFVFLKKAVLTRDWQRDYEKIKKLAVAGMLLLLPILSHGQEQEKKPVKKKWTVDYQYDHITDPGRNRSFDSHQLYVGYDKVYAFVMTDPYQIVDVGGYFGPFIVDGRYQFKSNGGAARIQYEHWFGDFVPHVMGGYGVFQQVPMMGNPSFPVGGAGMNIYFANEKSNIGLDAIKEFGRLHGLTYIGKVKIVSNSLWGTIGGTVTNFGYTGAFGQIGYKWFYVSADYYQHFDFNNYDRRSLGLGLKLQF